MKALQKLQKISKDMNEGNSKEETTDEKNDGRGVT